MATHGQAGARFGRPVGFPREPTHFPTSPRPLAVPLICPRGTKQMPERKAAGLFTPACLCLSFEVPPAPFCSRQSSPRLKRSAAPWEPRGLSARDAEDRTRRSQSSVPWQPTGMKLLQAGLCYRAHFLPIALNYSSALAEKQKAKPFFISSRTDCPPL